MIGTYVHPLVAPVFLILAPYAGNEPRIPTPMAIMGASMLAYLLLPPPSDLTAVVASQVLSRTASAALLWICRPAANAELPRITSLGAICAIATGLAVAWMADGYLLFVAVSLLAMRAVQLASYRAWGGIRPESLGWARRGFVIAILLSGQ